MHTTTWAVYRYIVNSLNEQGLRDALMQAYTLIEEQKTELIRQKTIIEQSAIASTLAGMQTKEYELTTPNENRRQD